MSLQEKFESARTLLSEHNAALGESTIGKIDADEFIQNIKLAGGTTEERLKGFSYEDILQCMVLNHKQGIKPVALAKDIAKIFRGKDEGSAEKDTRPVTAKKADRMSLKELIEAYDCEESTNPVGKRLKEISRGEKFIVFDTGRIVDVETSLKLLREVKDGYSARENIEVNGDIKEVHAVGDIPDNFVDENPLYRNRPLRPDGTCDQTNRSWNGVSTKVRQLIRVAIDTGVLKDISFERVHDIMDLVMEDKAFEKLSKRYPSAAVEFKKLEGLGKLPTLKLVLKKEAGRSNRPFDKAKKVNFTPIPDEMEAARKALEEAKRLGKIHKVDRPWTLPNGYGGYVGGGDGITWICNPDSYTQYWCDMNKKKD